MVSGIGTQTFRVGAVSIPHIVMNRFAPLETRPAASSLLTNYDNLIIRFRQS
jgi:hypothetical protein